MTGISHDIDAAIMTRKDAILEGFHAFFQWMDDQSRLDRGTVGM
jgi:hypothetical protein